jgi:DNA-binding MarR family transcriptional regulator
MRSRVWQHTDTTPPAPSCVGFEKHRGRPYNAYEDQPRTTRQQTTLQPDKDANQMTDNVNSVSSWISILHRYRRSFIMKKLEDYGALGRLHMLVLVINRHDGPSQEQVSEILKTDKASIARSVKKLEQEGYVVREPDASDKRANRLYLTEKAQALVPEIVSAVREWESLVVANVPPEAIATIECYLGQMAHDACRIYTAYNGKTKTPPAEG